MASVPYCHTPYHHPEPQKALEPPISPETPKVVFSYKFDFDQFWYIWATLANSSVNLTFGGRFLGLKTVSSPKYRNLKKNADFDRFRRF